MFVQYSFVERRPSSAATDWCSVEMTPAMVMSAGIAFMAITSVLYLLSN